MDENNKKISNYGYSFQTKLISSLMTDKNFFGSVYDILDIKYFDLEAIKFLIKVSKEYFIEYNECPTLEVFKVNIEKIKDDLFKQEIISALKQSVQYIEAIDLDYVKSETREFCRKQEFVNAILLAAQDVQNNDFDRAKSRIDNATKAGLDEDVGIDLVVDFDRRYESDARNPIATSWPVLNEVLKGGLSIGELGIIIASTGGGKSWLLAHLGVAALKMGKTVVHYTLELSETSVGFRYDCIISGISLDKIEHYKNDVKKIVETLPGKVIIKNYPTKFASLVTIKAHLSKLKVLGTIPDLVIIDYADLLKYHLGNNAKHDALEILYEEIRGLAGELKVPIWTASQVNRDGSGDDIIDGDKTAGAYSKLFPADIVMSISRKANDKLSNTARLFLIKSRVGPDGIVFPVYMDTNVGRIDIYEYVSEKGKELNSTMQSDRDYDRAQLKERYTNFKELQQIKKSDNLF